jgi:hypothetical protein
MDCHAKRLHVILRAGLGVFLLLWGIDKLAVRSARITCSSQIPVLGAFIALF